jgi:hypothetical protein
LGITLKAAGGGGGTVKLLLCDVPEWRMAEVVRERRSFDGIQIKGLDELLVPLDEGLSQASGDLSNL